MELKQFRAIINRAEDELTVQCPHLEHEYGGGICDILSWKMRHEFQNIFKPSRLSIDCFWFGNTMKSNVEGLKDRYTALRLFEEHCIANRIYRRF